MRHCGKSGPGEAIQWADDARTHETRGWRETTGPGPARRPRPIERWEPSPSRPRAVRGSTLAEGACQVILERLDEVAERGALTGLDEGLDRHSRHQGNTTKPFPLAGIELHLGLVVMHPGPLVGEGVAETETTLP